MASSLMDLQQQAIMRSLVAAQVALIEHVDGGSPRADIPQSMSKQALIAHLKSALSMTQELDD